MANSLQRGLSEGLGAAADIFKAKYMSDIKLRHEKALMEVRQKYRAQEMATQQQYRSQEVERKGILAGQAAKTEAEAMAAEGEVKRQHDIEMQSRKSAADLEREKLRGEYGLKEAGIRDKTKTSRYTGSDGRVYTFRDVSELFKTFYPHGPYDEEGNEISITDFAKERLGISDFIPGGDGNQMVEPESTEPQEEEKVFDKEPVMKAKTAREYYLHLKRKYKDRPEEVIRKQVRRKFPEWGG